MGFYLRKSIRVGPLRFNLSKSGVGVSAGVKGLRFRAGPRGNYIHMGRYGINYRASRPAVRPALDIPKGTHEPLAEIESADISEIVDSSSKELLSELNQKRQRMRLWPFSSFITLLALLIALSGGWPAWSAALICGSGLILILLSYRRDLLAKTVVVFYEFDTGLEGAYAQLHDSAEILATCSRAWHIEAEGRVRDRKYHAGASNLVRRSQTFIKKTEPPYVKTNVETIAIGVGKQVLHFFPDRILVYAANGVGAVSYPSLEIDVGQTRFIEDGSVPPDATVVDHTWRYVNKQGGPDRRFKNNRKLPICLYDEIGLSSASGLNEAIQVSRCGVAECLSIAIRRLCAQMPSEAVSSPSSTA